MPDRLLGKERVTGRLTLRPVPHVVGPQHAERPGNASHRAEVNQHRETLETLLKMRIATRLVGNEAGYPIYNQIDPVFNQALSLWPSAEELAELSGTP